MRMKEKGFATAAIIGIVVAVVAVVGVVAAVLVITPGLPSGDGDGTGDGGVTLSSVDFTISGTTTGGWSGAMRIRARNLGASPDIRVEETTGELQKIIVNNTASEYYIYGNDVWTKYTGALAEQVFQTMSLSFEGMTTTAQALITTHGTANFTATIGETTVTISSISANPTLGDDVFAPPAGATIVEYSF